MDVTKIAAADPAAAAAPGTPRANTPGAEDTAQRNALPAEDLVAALADRVDIHALDVASALQILIAEVRVELGLPTGAAPLHGSAPAAALPLAPPLQPAQSAAQAARQLVEVLLQALPPLDHEDVDESSTAGPASTAGAASMVGRASAPLEATLQLEATLRLAMDRAVDAVAAWRDVSAPVVDAAKDTRALVVTLLSDEPPSILWFQMEWLALAPRIQRYWRRRRRARQRLLLPRDMPGFKDRRE